MITLTITTAELDQAGFYLDGLDIDHSIDYFDVMIEEDANDNLYLHDFIPFDPSGVVTNDNIEAILFDESVNTASFDGSNCVLKDLEVALFSAAMSQIK